VSESATEKKNGAGFVVVKCVYVALTHSLALFSQLLSHFSRIFRTTIARTRDTGVQRVERERSMRFVTKKKLILQFFFAARGISIAATNFDI
jgi:hypothetical protein